MRAASASRVRTVGDCARGDAHGVGVALRGHPRTNRFHDRRETDLRERGIDVALSGDAHRRGKPHAYVGGRTKGLVPVDRSAQPRFGAEGDGAELLDFVAPVADRFDGAVVRRDQHVDRALRQEIQELVELLDAVGRAARDAALRRTPPGRERRRRTARFVLDRAHGQPGPPELADGHEALAEGGVGHHHIEVFTVIRRGATGHPPWLPCRLRVFVRHDPTTRIPWSQPKACGTPPNHRAYRNRGRNPSGRPGAVLHRVRRCAPAVATSPE